MQIDLIDMQSRPDGDYKYIGHFVDHFTKYHVLFAMKSKSANIVASNLVHKVFSYFGVPKIPHSDNGREFVNRVIENIIKSWPGRVQLITGRPRHSKHRDWWSRAITQWSECCQPYSVTPAAKLGFMATTNTV